MTTSLEKPIARMILLDDEPFKVVISPEGVSVSPKGRRQRPMVPWTAIIAIAEIDTRPHGANPVDSSDKPSGVLGEIAQDIHNADVALQRARQRLMQGGDLPAELRSRMEVDPVYGAAEHRSDWFIEPLLTVAELASVLRVSPANVRRLPIPSITVSGEQRYRQSAVREYLRDQESEPRARW